MCVFETDRKGQNIWMKGYVDIWTILHLHGRFATFLWRRIEAKARRGLYVRHAPFKLSRCVPVCPRLSERNLKYILPSLCPPASCRWMDGALTERSVGNLLSGRSSLIWIDMNPMDARLSVPAAVACLATS